MFGWNIAKAPLKKIEEMDIEMRNNLIIYIRCCFFIFLVVG